MAIDTSIQTELHGRRLGLNAEDDVCGLIYGQPAIIMPSRPGRLVRLFDDFLGDSVGATWNEREGADTSTSTSAVVAGAKGGVLRLTTGDSATLTMAGNGIQIESACNWYAENGGLFFEARVALDAITTTSWFIGLTDQVAALEMPIQSAASANTITTNAADAVGLFFDTAMSTDEWYAAGVANGTDATHVSIGSAPVAATYETLSFFVNADGDATFYRNGVRVAAVADAVTPTVALTPVFAGFALATSARNLDVDYIDLRMHR